MSGGNMLIITLRDEESISIGESIKIKVLRTRGSDVQLGIDAPSDMKIRRSNLLNRSQQRQDEE
jgi:carbon storage regulator